MCNTKRFGTVILVFFAFACNARNLPFYFFFFFFSFLSVFLNEQTEVIFIFFPITALSACDQHWSCSYGILCAFKSCPLERNSNDGFSLLITVFGRTAKSVFRKVTQESFVTQDSCDQNRIYFICHTKRFS